MLKHTLLYLGVRALNGVLALATLALLTRLMPPEAFGRYALGQSLVGAGAAVALQWLNTAYSRFHVSQAEGPDGPLLALALLIWRRVALGALGVAALALVLLPGQALEPLGVLAMGLGVGAMGLFNLHLQIANARAEPLRYGRLTVTRASLFLGLALLALWRGGGAAGVLLAFALAAALACVLGGLPLRSRAQADPALLRPLLHYGAPQALGFLVLALTETGDRLILAAWHGSAAVAGYAAAGDLSQQTLYVLLGVAYLGGFPHLVRTWEAEGPDAAQRWLRRIAQGQGLLAGACCAVALPLSPWIAVLAFGPDVGAQAGPLMPWIALAATLAGLRLFLCDLPFQLLKRSGVPLVGSALVAACSLLGNLWLVPAHGAQGAAWVAAGAMALGLLFSYGLGRRSGLTPALGADALKLLACVALAAWTVHQLAPAAPGARVALEFAALGAVALLGYGALALALNLGGLRTWVLGRLRRR